MMDKRWKIRTKMEIEAYLKSMEADIKAIKERNEKCKEAVQKARDCLYNMDWDIKTLEELIRWYRGDENGR